MAIKLDLWERGLLKNICSDPTIEICECCPKIGASDCEDHCVADSLLKKVKSDEEGLNV